jgi:Protein of unknown function (DUF3788)
MLANAFVGSPEQPTDQELTAALGPAKALWDKLVADLALRHNVATREWNCYSRKAGWSLRLKRGKRAIVYLSPSRGCFMASFALGEKAVAAARAKLPFGVVQAIDKAKLYPEGRAVRLDVKSSKDLKTVETLAVVKLES